MLNHSHISRLSGCTSTRRHHDLSQKPLGCTANLPGPLRAMKAATPRYASDGSNEYAPQPSGQSLRERIKVRTVGNLGGVAVGSPRV